MELKLLLDNTASIILYKILVYKQNKRKNYSTLLMAINGLFLTRLNYLLLLSLLSTDLLYT